MCFIFYDNIFHISKFESVIHILTVVEGIKLLLNRISGHNSFKPESIYISIDFIRKRIKMVEAGWTPDQCTRY